MSTAIPHWFATSRISPFAFAEMRKPVYADSKHVLVVWTIRSIDAHPSLATARCAKGDFSSNDPEHQDFQDSSSSLESSPAEGDAIVRRMADSVSMTTSCGVDAFTNSSTRVNAHRTHCVGLPSARALASRRERKYDFEANASSISRASGCSS